MQQDTGVHTRYTHACGVWVVFMEHGGGALGIFESPVCTYNQACGPSLCPLHTIFPSCANVAGGVRRPPAERSALYIVACTRRCPVYYCL